MHVDNTQNDKIHKLRQKTRIFFFVTNFFGIDCSGDVILKLQTFK